MNIKLDVLGVTMIEGIARHVDTGYVVPVGHRSFVDVAMKFTEEMTEP
jgi:hypothetical protein